MFSELISHLKLILEQLTDPNTGQRASPNFDLNEFWLQFLAVSQAVSHSATKVSITCEPPLPDNQECECLCADVEKTCLSLVSVFYSLPSHQGSLLVHQCRSATRDIVTGMLVLLAKIDSDENLLHSLHYTGTVWSACDDVQALPRDNRGVLLKKIKETQGLVTDALEEIEESLRDDSEGLLDGEEAENRDAWSEEDRELIKPCLVMVKATGKVLKRLKDGVEQCSVADDAACIRCMDEMHGEHVDRVSPCVDDLVAGLYAPLQRAVVRQNAAAMAELLHNIAEFSRSCVLWAGSDVTWVDTLTRGVDHNMEKVKTMTRDCV